MPSGKIHDAITLALAIPAFAAGFAATGSILVSSILAAGFIFGGLMFGPDLDTGSKQYSRWWIFRALWFPYQRFFKHRSRWSHGLIFGTLFRVIYFAGIISLGGFLTLYVLELFSGTKLAGAEDLFQAWRRLGQEFRVHIGESIAVAAFLGLWLGAAAHTFTDIAGTYIKTGRRQRSL